MFIEADPAGSLNIESYWIIRRRLIFEIVVHRQIQLCDDSAISLILISCIIRYLFKITKTTRFGGLIKGKRNWKTITPFSTWSSVSRISISLELMVRSAGKLIVWLRNAIKTVLILSLYFVTYNWSPISVPQSLSFARAWHEGQECKFVVIDVLYHYLIL